MRQIAYLAVLFMVSTGLHAASPLSPEVCQGFAREPLMDSRSFMAAAYNYQQHMEMVCRNTSKGTEAKFGLASSFSTIVNYVPVSGSGSADLAYKKSYVDGYCRHIEGMSEESRRVAFSSQEFSANMKETTQSCLEIVKAAALDRARIFAYAEPNNSQLTSYVVTVDVKPSPRQEVELTGYSSNGAVCSFRGQPVEKMELNLDGSTMFVCNKLGDEGTSLVLHTAKMGDVSVRLPGQTDAKIETMQVQIDSLSNMLRHQAEREVILSNCEFPTGDAYNVTNIGWNLPSYNNMWNKMDHPVNADCPSGKVIIGVNSAHRNEYEDRQWRYKCCTVELSP
ncbi:hypothetical protein [Marilutibacter aestuarii]|uniref:Uncharacterized protein n=1 Tax=Marilutibacter aestuarii TaxID=1706195 RepID=A0A508ANB3_9GAMM|nr:hypothetical protein [Lysobacter aestuarii]TQD51249.1 hypothetical protein FKV25_02115 [Lysobacter aestuarii]